MSPHNKEITATNQNFPQLCSHTFLPGIGEHTDTLVSSTARDMQGVAVVVLAPRAVWTQKSHRCLPHASELLELLSAETSTAPWCLGLGSLDGMTFYRSGFS